MIVDQCLRRQVDPASITAEHGEIAINFTGALFQPGNIIRAGVDRRPTRHELLHSIALAINPSFGLGKFVHVDPAQKKSGSDLRFLLDRFNLRGGGFDRIDLRKSTDDQKRR